MIKKNIIPYVLVLIVGGLILAYQLMPEIIPQANADDYVGVTATVSTSVSCTSLPDASSTFGTLTTTQVSTSTPWATTTLSCNYANGCTLSVNDSGNGGGNPGLYATDAVDTIGSATAGYADTATLAAGTEGYGIKGATTSAGSGQTLRMQNPRYNRYDLGGYYSYQVGGLELTEQQIASSTLPVANRELEVIHLAAIDGLVKASTQYGDTIYYTCLGN